jgi:HAD superfamily hydrolase (TIGR01509 family)
VLAPDLLASLRGIIFDMDGVLLDSSPIHAGAYREALVALPMGEIDYSRVAGMRSRDGMRKLLREAAIELSDDQIETLAVAKTRIALARIIAENPIVPGMREVLQVLSQQYPLALATSASPAGMNAFLDQNDMRPLFCCVIHSGDVEQAKPAPDIFESAARGIDVVAGDCLVVEDAVAGIEAAKAAGAVACGIPSTCTSDQLEAAGADCIIDRLEDLLEIGAQR